MLIHKLIKGERPCIQDSTVQTIIIILYRLSDVNRAVCFVYTLNCRSIHFYTSLLVSLHIIAYNTIIVNKLRILKYYFRI